MKLVQRIAIATLVLVLVASVAPAASGSARQLAPGALDPSQGGQPQAGIAVYLPLILKPSLFLNIADGDNVARTITLIGTYPSTVTEDLWIFVLPHANNRYYPQSLDACKRERTPKVNGRWEMRVGLGGPTNAGEKFDILLTSATATANEGILDTLEAWCKVNNYPGLTSLPAGLTILDRITVTRTADLWGPAPKISADTLPGTATITSPLDGAQVGQQDTVRGTYTPDVVNAIWLLIYASNGRWYPQSYDACKGVHVHKANGLWDVLATFGGSGDVGRPFDIVVVLADSNASGALDAKQREWCAKNDYRGWLTIELPQKIAEKQRIRVYRK